MILLIQRMRIIVADSDDLQSYLFLEMMRLVQTSLLIWTYLQNIDQTFVFILIIIVLLKKNQNTLCTEIVI